jgi:hypothetical protein
VQADIFNPKISEVHEKCGERKHIELRVVSSATHVLLQHKLPHHHPAFPIWVVIKNETYAFTYKKMTSCWRIHFNKIPCLLENVRIIVSSHYFVNLTETTSRWRWQALMRAFHHIVLEIYKNVYSLLNAPHLRIGVGNRSESNFSLSTQYLINAIRSKLCRK